MTTTTITPATPEYRAQADGGKWHLGSTERGALCFCGCLLMTPEDTRAFALKVPAEKRTYQTDPDVAKVTCGSCKRNREYAKATAAPLAEAAAGRPSRRRTPAAKPKAAR